MTNTSAADAEHYQALERMYVAAPTNAYYQPTIKIEKGSCTIRIEVQEKFFHAAGAVHGSVYFKLLDDASFFASNALVKDVFVLTAQYDVHLVRPVTKGVMEAHGEVKQFGRRIILADAQIVDAKGRLLARGSGTFMRSETRLIDVPHYASTEVGASTEGGLA